MQNDKKGIHSDKTLLIYSKNKTGSRSAISIDTVISLLSKHSQVISDCDHTTETEIITLIQKNSPKLIFIPWRDYLRFHHLDSILGVARTKGPICIGYQLENDQNFSMLCEPPHTLRYHALDFSQIQGSDISWLMKSLLKDNLRSQFQGILAPGSVLYANTWYHGLALGDWMEQFFNLPEIVYSNWIKKSLSIRIIFLALWSIIFEEGPGRLEYRLHRFNNSPRAFFQVGINERCLCFRIHYFMNGWSTQNLIQSFWPKDEIPGSPFQLLLFYSDFLRIHTVGLSPQIEIVATLFSDKPTSPSSKGPTMLWIDPLSEEYFEEKIRFAQFKCKPFPENLGTQSHSTKGTSPKLTSIDGFQNSISADTPFRLESLEKKCQDLENQIQEMKTGGVGVQGASPPPETEILLDSFCRRYRAANEQLKQFKTLPLGNENNCDVDSQISRLEKQIQRWKMDLLNVLTEN